MTHAHLPPIGRRGLLLGLSALATLGGARLAVAQNGPPPGGRGERRLVVIVLRGAMDGLHAVVPYGDADYAGLRGALALPEPGREGGVHDLGGFFGLHPALRGMADLYRSGELLPVQAVAGPYRTRSHFEGQDLLEGGAEQRLNAGWLNRALSQMGGGPQGPRRGLSVGAGVPLILRGPEPVGSWAPARPQRPHEELLGRMADLLHEDPVLGRGMQEGLRGRGFATAAMASAEPLGGGGFQILAAAAGRLLAARDGPRVAALEIGGWDTHAMQGNRMQPALAQLDGGLMALRRELGAAWAQTVVFCVTEFGRTARPNGNMGTDHGTGGAAFLAGGAVRGARVLTDWPGLRDDRLFEGRDLQPTRDLRAIAKGLLRDHLRLPPAALAAAFPGSAAVAPEGQLLRG
jgi:uncharacterized protein (DUF1501 family)